MSEDFEPDDSQEAELSLEELKEVAADWRSPSAERLRACLDLRSEERETGRDLLLAFSVCLDTEDEDRLAALQHLVRMDPATVAAAAWLMWETDYGHLEPGYKHEAASIIHDCGDVREQLPAGLAVILANPHLADLYRIWAGAYRTIEWTGDSYAELRRLFSDKSIVRELAEVAKRGAMTSGQVLIGHTALPQIVQDGSLPTAMRFEAADWIHIGSNDHGADAFETLVTDPGLADADRLRAARELATIDEERAAGVYPDMRDALFSSDTTAHSSPTGEEPPELR